MESNGVLVHVYKEHASQFIINNLLTYYAQPLANLKASQDHEILTAVCFFCDILEYGGMDIFNLTAPKAAEKFIECI